MKITKKQIEKVIAGFDFETCAAVYQLMNWKWFRSGIPNADELRQEAIRLLGDLRENANAQNIRSGGLKVSRYYEDKITIVKLEFIALSSVHDNLD